MLCGTCGTVLTDQVLADASPVRVDAHGLCVNMHDNWVELRDFDDPDLVGHLRDAAKNLGITMEGLHLAVRNAEAYSELNRQHEKAKRLLAAAGCMIEDAIVNHIYMDDQLNDEGKPIDEDTGELLDCPYDTISMGIDDFLGRGNAPRWVREK